MSRVLNAQCPALTPLMVIPTTVAGITLWNGESQTAPNAGGVGLCYVIDSIFAFFVVTQAASSHLSLWVQVNKGVQAQPTGTACPGQSTSYGESVAVAAAANTFVSKSTVVSGATVANDAWSPYGNSLVVANTANSFLVLDVPVESFVLQPGFQFSVHGIVPAGAVAASLQIGIAWRELTRARAMSAVAGGF